MSYPTKYTRQYDYISYQNANPSKPLPANQVHADLNQVATSTGEIVDFLKTSLRSDGAIMNGAVSFDLLSTSVKASIGDTTSVDEILTAKYDAVAAASTAAPRRRATPPASSWQRLRAPRQCRAHSKARRQ
jgi:hypothetical protein